MNVNEQASIFILFHLFIFRGIFDTIIPVEGGNGGPILIRLPITYNIDSGRYVKVFLI